MNAAAAKHKEADRSVMIEKRILEELIYERVRVSVNLCQLVLFEQDLDKSIQRALRACSGTESERVALARTYMDSAWRRVEREWNSLRAQVGVGGDDLDDSGVDEAYGGDMDGGNMDGGDVDGGNVDERSMTAI